MRRRWILEANEFRSLVLISTPKGFEIEALPNRAQSFPFLDCLATDLTNDGLDDLIAVGNIYHTEIETPRWDAGTGTILVSDTLERFRVSPVEENNLFIEGNAKSLLLVDQKQGSQMLIVARNNGSIGTFEVKK